MYWIIQCDIEQGRGVFILFRLSVSASRCDVGDCGDVEESFISERKRGQNECGTRSAVCLGSVSFLLLADGSVSSGLASLSASVFAFFLAVQCITKRRTTRTTIKSPLNTEAPGTRRVKFGAMISCPRYLR